MTGLVGPLVSFQMPGDHHFNNISTTNIKLEIIISRKFTFVNLNNCTNFISLKYILRAFRITRPCKHP